MTSFIRYIKRLYQPKEKLLFLRVEPPTLFNEIDAIPRSIGIWSSSDLQLLQFDYTYFEVILISVFASFPPQRLSSSLTGRIEETGAEMHISLKTKTHPVLIFSIVILLLLGLVVLFQVLFMGVAAEKLLIATFVSIFLPIGLLRYKDFTDKLILERFEDYLQVNLKSLEKDTKAPISLHTNSA